MNTAFQHLIVSLREFRDANSGTTAIEYALIAGSLSVVIIVIVNAMGLTLVDLFTAIQTGFPDVS